MTRRHADPADRTRWLPLPHVFPRLVVDVAVAIGAIPPGRQVSTAHTGWTTEQRRRMAEQGYDGMDSIAAWYG